MTALIALEPTTHPRPCFHIADYEGRSTASFTLAQFVGITLNAAYPTYLYDPQHVRVLHMATQATLLKRQTILLISLYLELCAWLGLPKEVPALLSAPEIMPISWGDQFDFGGTGGQFLRNAAQNAIHHFTGICGTRYDTRIETLVQVQLLAVAVDSYVQHRQASSKPTSTLEDLQGCISVWLTCHNARAGGCA